jgi:hypothetical protein
MRIWDISPQRLCRQHLLGEHRELHAIWSILTGDKKAFCNHPEIKRWRGKLKALYLRHEKLVKEMKKRGYGHFSPLRYSLAGGKVKQTKFVNSIEEQIKILKNKKCHCDV